jgi:hypothetical protein
VLLIPEKDNIRCIAGIVGAVLTGKLREGVMLELGGLCEAVFVGISDATICMNSGGCVGVGVRVGRIVKAGVGAITQPFVELWQIVLTI